MLTSTRRTAQSASAFVRMAMYGQGTVREQALAALAALAAKTRVDLWLEVEQIVDAVGPKHPAMRSTSTGLMRKCRRFTREVEDSV